MEFPHAFGFPIVDTSPCPQNSIIVNPPSPSEILKAVRGIVWIFSGIAHSNSHQILLYGRRLESKDEYNYVLFYEVLLTFAV